MKKQRHKGRSPNYWWDFKHYDNKMTIIVQSDMECYPILKEYELPEHGPADREIDAACILINGLKEGRISPTKV